MNRITALPIAIALFLALAAGMPGLATAQGALPDGFYGKFRGAYEVPGNISGEFAVAIEKRRGGFIVRWTPRIAVEFESAGRPGVFRADGGDEKPMSGDPVYWARLADGRLIVYEMQMDEHGGNFIQRFEYAPAAGGLELMIRRIRTGSGPKEWAGKLDRYDG